jgi:glycosyltransferase involved in cell wall biosynthesis
MHRLPAYSRCLSVMAFEYMAAGPPFVITDDAPKRRTFSGYARFADPADPVEIAAQIRRLISDPDLAIRLGTSGRAAVVREFSWEAEAGKLIDLYQRLIGPPGPG